VGKIRLIAIVLKLQQVMYSLLLLLSMVIVADAMLKVNGS